MRSTRSDILIHLDELMFVIHEKHVVNDKSITTSYGKLILMVYGICSYFIDVTLWRGCRSNFAVDVKHYRFTDSGTIDIVTTTAGTTEFNVTVTRSYD